ncbi:MAG: hypothetical protein LBC86_04145 [Oscillospiraceae bacterium]|nr:hypothetical protein [Oscillospiraceae bacterium]
MHILMTRGVKTSGFLAFVLLLPKINVPNSSNNAETGIISIFPAPAKFPENIMKSVVEAIGASEFKTIHLIF